MRMRASTPAAFTLIEMIISASVMSIILIATYLCLRSGMLSQKLVDQRTAVVQNGRVAMALMTADLRAACPLTKDFAFIGMKRTLEDMDADNLDFATHNFTPTRVGEGDWCEVSYFVARSEGSEGFSLWRRRDPTPDDEPFSGGSREEIARGLRGLTLEYYNGIEWFEEWGDTKGKADNSFKERPNLRGTPDAVRITLTLAPETRATRQDSNNSTEEPPLVFTTVCRLNLAGVSSDPGLTGSANNPRTGDAPPANPPDGGQQ
jgi:type II secretion system protein J